MILCYRHGTISAIGRPAVQLLASYLSNWMLCLCRDHLRLFKSAVLCCRWFSI